MPKIRKKARLLVNSEYRKKSGILTRSLKNIIKKDNKRKDFFNNIFLHEQFDPGLESKPYNDDNTILFVDKLVNQTLPLEEKYKNKNKVLHTPNEFDTTQTINKLVESNVYSKLIYPNYDSKKRRNTFLETFSTSKEDLEGNKETISLVLDFNEQCKLSINNTNPDETITLGGETYKVSNSNVAYYNFERKSWDYLGDVAENYFSNYLSFQACPIAFNSISTKNSYEAKNMSLGLPVNMLGFPFDSKFQGMNRHLYKMSKHINKPFVLEDIKIKFIASNLSETEASNAYELLNSLSFFVINQRKNLNELSFENLGFDNTTYNAYYIDEISFHGNTPITHSVNQTPEFTIITDPGNAKENFVTFTGNFDASTLKHDELQASQRELVSYLTLVNYSSGGIKNSNLDIENIRNNADFFYENQSSPVDSSNFNECNYERKDIIMSGKCRTPVYHEEIEKISNLNVYPTVKFRNRTGTGYRTDRSYETDFGIKKESEDYTDNFNRSLNISKEIFKENQYILLPEDSLIFGFSFNTNMDFIENSKFAKDIMFLHDKLEINLIGRYHRNKQPFKHIQKTFTQNDKKEIFHFENINLTDGLGLNSIYLSKGAYYDNEKFYIPSLSIGLIQTNPIIIPNILSSAILGKSRSFLNYNLLFDKYDYLVDRLPNDEINQKEYLFHLTKFGQPYCLYNGFTHTAYVEVNNSNNIFYYVNKSNVNTYFEEVSPTSVKTYNKDRYARIEYPDAFKEEWIIFRIFEFCNTYIKSLGEKCQVS